MERAVEMLAVVAFLIIGLSHIIQPRAWAQFFVYLHSLGKPGIIINAFLALNGGVIIVAFHNVWRGIPLVLTLLGWGWVLKGAIYFLFPAVGIRALGRINESKPGMFVVAGVILVALSGLLLYSLLTSPITSPA